MRTLSLRHSLYFPFSSVNIFGHSSSPLLFSHNPFKVDIFPFSFLLFLISVLLYFLLYVSEMAEQFHNPLQIPSSHSAHKPRQGHTHTHTHKSNKHITNRRHRGILIFCSWFYHEIRNLHLLPLLLMVVVKGVAQICSVKRS